MAYTTAAPRTQLALWSTRLALFAISLILTALILHRFAGFPTGLLLNTLIIGFALNTAALLLALAAFVVIWRNGVAGTAKAIAGFVLSLLVFVWPATIIPTALELPAIHDITTDPSQPPQFRQAARLRAIDANSTQYPGAQTAHQQFEAYPYIKPIIVDRSVQEAFELARRVIKRLGWTIVASQPPRGRNAPIGRIEATDKTLILGFVDDIVIRITGNNQNALVDVRSASRFGRHDFGRNAARIESFARVFKASLQATVSIAAERARSKTSKQTKAKRRKVSRRKKRRRRRSRSQN